jgi:hypothetical protein
VYVPLDAVHYIAYFVNAVGGHDESDERERELQGLSLDGEEQGEHCSANAPACAKHDLMLKQGKAGKSYRDKYRSFWVAWVEKLLSLPRERGGKRVLGHEILRTAIDQMVALSSMAVVNVRDAVTEAALSVSEAVLQACGALRAELEATRRQIAAEESNRSKAQAMQNPRYVACVQQRDTVTKVTLWSAVLLILVVCSSFFVIFYDMCSAFR